MNAESSVIHSNDESAARYWPFIAKAIYKEAEIGVWASTQGKFVAGLYEFIRFGIKQGWACLFGGIMVALLISTKLFYPEHAVVSRYDFLVVAALVVQILLLVWKLETWEEAKVIFLFHVVGTIMEIFKTTKGSWIYPEASILRIGGVPLFTGFMYASVGSYLARVWRLFDFQFDHHPSLVLTTLLSIAIYINFFAHHYIMDMRLALFALTGILFAKTWVYFRVWHTHRKMPLLLGFFLVTLFIWFAENIGTLCGAWLYPAQMKGWAMVPLAKIGSWFLLMIISYAMVAAVNKPKARKATIYSE